MKRLTHPKRIAGGLIFALFFLTISPFIHGTINSIEIAYYERAPLSNFLDPGILTVSDICFGDLTQDWKSTRQVHISNGLPAHVTRELFIIYPGGVRAKIKEDNAEIFIEPREGEYAYRRVSYDQPLGIGKYQWILKVSEVNLPNGVIRRDYPLIVSNIFEVKGCIYDPIQK